MQNARLDEAQAGIKTAGRNVSNLRYAYTTLMAESEEELKSLLMQVKEESEKAGLKLNIHTHTKQTNKQKKQQQKRNSTFKNEDHGIWSHHFMANRWGESGNNDSCYFLGLQNHCRW